jgi:hypothetical protein
MRSPFLVLLVPADDPALGHLGWRRTRGRLEISHVGMASLGSIDD